MVCLWLVLIPGLIIALCGVVFDLRWLAIPIFFTTILAHFIFSKWKTLSEMLSKDDF